jgi:hypothetical protein
MEFYIKVHKLLASKGIKYAKNLSYCDTGSGTGLLIQVNGKAYLSDHALTKLILIDLSEVN